MSDEPFSFAIDRSTYNAFLVASHGNFVKVDVPGGVVTVRAALLMAGALIRSALTSALTYSDGVTEEYLIRSLNEGGDFPSHKGQDLLRKLHSPERQDDYNRGYADGYDLGHKHGFDQ